MVIKTATSALLVAEGLSFLMELNPILSVVGTIASVVALVATYGFHREIHPKRRLTFRISVNPLMPNEMNGGNGLNVSYSGLTIEHPFLVTVTIRSQGKADIQSTSFASQTPIRFDLNAPTYGPLGTPLGRSAHDVPVAVKGSSIGIGPAQLKKDFYLKFMCLCNGPPQVVARNCLTDIDLVDVSVKEGKLAPLHRKLGRAFKWSWYELIAVTIAFFLLAVMMLFWPATVPFVNSQMTDGFGWVFVFGWGLGFIGVLISAVGFIVTLMPMRIIAMHDKIPDGLQPAPAP